MVTEFTCVVTGFFFEMHGGSIFFLGGGNFDVKNPSFSQLHAGEDLLHLKARFRGEEKPSQGGHAGAG